MRYVIVTTLVLVASHLLMADERNPPKLFKVSKDVIADAHRYVPVDFSKQKHVMKHPGMFHGESISGLVPIRNDTDEAVHIDSMSTSCGCTAARVQTAKVEPGQLTHVLFKVAGDKGEKFDVTIKLYTNKGRLDLQVTGPIYLPVRVASIRPRDDGSIDVGIIVDNPSLNATKVTLAGGTWIRGSGNAALFNLPKTAVTGETLTLRPRHGGDDLNPLVVKLTAKGVLKCPVQVVNATRGMERRLSFRVFLIGDVSLWRKESKVEIISNGEPLEGEVNVKKVGKSLVLECDVETDSDRFDAIVQIDDSKTPVKVQVR